MSAPLSVNARARDLTFHVQDSCNFCCWSCCHSSDPRTHVYVNSKGEVVEFDVKKAAVEIEALKRCISNLQHIIGDMAEAHQKDKAELLMEISSKIAPLNLDQPAPLSLGVVQRISSFIKSYVE